MPDLDFLNSFFEEKICKTGSMFLIDQRNETSSKENDQGRRDY